MYKCVWISKQLIVLNSFVYSNFNYCLLIWHFGSNNFKLEINTRTSSQNCIALSIPLKERLGAPSSSPVVWASLHVGCHPLFFPPKKLSSLPFLYVSPSTVLDRKPNIGQKASFFVFAAHLQFNNHDKKFIGIKSFNIKQCPAGLSLRIKPSCILPLKKNAPSFNPPLLPPSSMSFAARRSQMRKRTIMRKIEKY